LSVFATFQDLPPVIPLHRSNSLSCKEEILRSAQFSLDTSRVRYL
jgi:hypothetical protein